MGGKRSFILYLLYKPKEVVDKKNIFNYIRKILTGHADKEDEDLVDQHFYESFYSEEWNSKDLGDRKEVEERILSQVSNKIKPTKPRRLKRYLQYAAVLVALLVVGQVVKYAIFRDSILTKIDQKQEFLLPGKEVASLTLSDGTLLDLSEMEVGEEVGQDGFQLHKTQEGQLAYTSDSKTSTTEASRKWNKLTTPPGGQYQITLADGTRAWLNAGSTLLFPTSFSGNQRLVKASGEVYFEVAHDKSKPFLVHTDNIDVEVLGTTFNLSTFYGNSSSVALVEGAVKLKSGGEQAILAPGDKGALKNGRIEISTFDTESELAWKNNYFIFKNQNIKEIMSALARWYDAEVVYKGTDWENINFTIRMSRRENIAEILSIIEATQSIQFSIEGRRVTVTKN